MKEGWKRVALEEIGKVLNGGTPKTKVSDYWDGEHLWITPAEMGSRDTPYIAESRRKLTDAGLRHSSASLVPAHSVILSTRAPIGHLVINREPMAFNQGCRGIVPGDSVHYKYLYYFLLYSVDVLNDLGTGTTFKELSAGKLKKVQIPLPPLPDQKRIVAILDEAFAGIATAVANTEKNLANARELFDSTSQSIFENAVCWDQKQLKELLELGWIVSHLDGNHGGDYPKKSEFVDAGVSYISANCIKDDSVDLSLAKFLTTERASSLRKGIAQNRDVLFAHNATVGPVAILYTDADKVVLSTSLTYYRCNSDYILPEYLAHYMRSPEFKSQYELVMRQSTRNQVPITKQREFLHRIPPLKAQKEIADQLDGVRSETQRLSGIHKRKLTALAELKQSLLQKAFSGELTSETEPLKEEAVA